MGRLTRQNRNPEFHPQMDPVGEMINAISTGRRTRSARGPILCTPRESLPNTSKKDAPAEPIRQTGTRSSGRVKRVDYGNESVESGPDSDASDECVPEVQEDSDSDADSDLSTDSDYEIESLHDQAKEQDFPILPDTFEPAPGPGTKDGSQYLDSPTAHCSTRSPTPDDLRVLLDFYGKAMVQCAFDHTPETAVEHERNIAKARQEVINHHESAMREVRLEVSDRARINAHELEIANHSIVAMKKEIQDQEKEIEWKDEQMASKQKLLDSYQVLYAVAMEEKREIEAKSEGVEVEKEAQRRRVMASFEASKKAKLS